MPEALRRFDSMEVALAPENREMYDKFVRFIGQAFVKGLGFRGTNVAKVPDGKAYLGIELPATDTQLEVPRLLTAAMHRRSGAEWAFIYRQQRKRRDALR